MIISGLQKTTLIDYPGKVACTVFTRGCNFRCGYCYNKELVLSNAPSIALDEFFIFLETRRNFLDGVCITGGEPTIHKDLPEFCRRIQDLGLFVKLDTNGSNPEMLRRLIDEGLVDYIAMDIKASLQRYAQVVGREVDLGALQRSVDLIISSGVDYEFRTTVIPYHLDNDAFRSIRTLCAGAKRFVLQEFRTGDLINPAYNAMERQNTLERYQDELRETIPEVTIRLS